MTISEAVREDVSIALEEWYESSESKHKFGDYDNDEFDDIKVRIEQAYKEVVNDNEL